LAIPAGSLAKELMLIAVTDKTESGETVYRFGAENIELSQKATLTINYTDKFDDSQIAIYHKENEIWKSIGGTVNLENESISVQVSRLGDFKVAKGNPDAVVDGELIPDTYQLFQNYPNPFNPGTTIRYAIPEAGFVKLTVFNILGEEVATLVEKQQKAGFHRLEWNAFGNGSGIYFFRLECNDFRKIRKMTVIK
jgi:hypothetical protein